MRLTREPLQLSNHFLDETPLIIDFVSFCKEGREVKGESLPKLKRKMFLYKFLEENSILGRTSKDANI
jgi:hypothetical protein